MEEAAEEAHRKMALVEGVVHLIEVRVVAEELGNAVEEEEEVRCLFLVVVGLDGKNLVVRGEHLRMVLKESSEAKVEEGCLPEEPYVHLNAMAANLMREVEGVERVLGRVSLVVVRRPFDP